MMLKQTQIPAACGVDREGMVKLRKCWREQVQGGCGNRRVTQDEKFWTSFQKEVIKAKLRFL